MSRIVILIAWANPDETALLTPDAEIKAIQEGIKKGKQRDLFEEARIYPQTSLRELVEGIQRHNPHIVHFIGHGADEGELLFVEQREVEYHEPDAPMRRSRKSVRQPISGDALGRIFEGREFRPRLIVLNACHSFTAAEALAQRIDFVIGVNGRTHNRYGEEFAGMFYGALANGLPLGDAFAVARVQLGDRPAGVSQPPPDLRWLARSGTILDIRSWLCADLPQPQNSLLDALRRNFVGRVDLFQQLEQSLANPKGAHHFIVSAPAGYGKSAFAARLVELHPEFLYHFVRAEDQHHTATSLLANLCSQLAQRTGKPASYAGVSLASLEEEFDRLKALALGRLDQNSRLVLVLDGLDEAERHGTESILKPRYFRVESEQLRFVLTYRSGYLAPRVDLDLRQIEEREISGLRANEVAELFRLLGRDDLAEDQALANALVVKTNGEPFYLRFLVEDLSKQRGSVTVPVELPDDSKSYIAQQIKNLTGYRLLRSIPPEVSSQSFSVSAARCAGAILQTLVACQDWITRAQLFRLLEPIDRVLVEALIDELRRYFVTDRPRDPIQVLTERYLISPLKLKEAIQSAYTPEELVEAERRVLSFCHAWSLPAHNPYAFQYLTHHLISLGDYNQLLATVDQPFLKAKSAALGGAHTVLIDIERTLRYCLDRGDTLKVIRMLLLFARTLHLAEQRALHGGVVIDAMKGLYEIALSSARSIHDPEMRFRQLLLIAHVAAQEANADHESRVRIGRILDEALAVTIQRREFPSEQIESLLTRLLVQNRLIDGAIALAQKVGPQVNWHWNEEQQKHVPDTDANEMLSRACLQVIDDDAALASELLNRVSPDYRWYELNLTIVRRLLDTQPVVARQWLDSMIERVEHQGAYSYSLEAASLLRQFDGQAALAIVRRVVRHAEEQSPADNRSMGQLLNRAATYLAQFHVQEALDLALSRCPDVIDSEWTRLRTLASILNIATESLITVPANALNAVLDALLSENVDNSWSQKDEARRALVLQFGMQSEIADAHKLLETIEDPTIRALAAAQLWRIRADVGPEALAGVLSEVEHLHESFANLCDVIRDLFERNAESTFQVIAAVRRPWIRFALLNCLLKHDSSVRASLVIPLCIETIACMEAEDQTEPLLALTQAVSAFDSALAKQLFERLFETVVNRDAGKEWRYREIAELASALGYAPEAAKAVSLALQALEDSPRGLKDHYSHLARFVVDTRISLGDDVIHVLLKSIRDPYTTGMLVSRLADREGYVNSQLEQIGLGFGGFNACLTAHAQAKQSISGLRRVLDLMREPEDQAFLLARVAEVEWKIGHEALARAEVQRAWQLLESLGPPSPELRQTERAQARRIEELKYGVAEILSRIDARAAVERSRQLSPWNQHLVLAASAWEVKNDVDLAREIFQRAREAARTVDGAHNQFRALINVSSYSRGPFPDFSSECALEAMNLMHDVDDLDETVLMCAELICQKALLPAGQIEGVWDKLVAALSNNRWCITTQKEIFHSLAKIEDQADFPRASQYIARSLVRLRTDSVDKSTEIARLAALMARRGQDGLAQTLLTFCENGIEPDGETPHAARIETLTDVVCAKRSLRQPDAENELEMLLERAVHEVRTGSLWSFVAGRVVRTLAAEYPGIIRNNAWNRLIELCDLMDREDRSQSLLALVEAAVTKAELETVVPLLSVIPIRSYHAAAVAAVCEKMEQWNGTSLTREQKSLWQRVFDAAAQSVPALLACADSWCCSYLEVQHTTEAVDAAVAALLAECEFVQWSSDAAR